MLFETIALLCGGRFLYIKNVLTTFTGNEHHNSKNVNNMTKRKLFNLRAYFVLRYINVPLTHLMLSNGRKMTSHLILDYKS